ncbi:MAG: hypothetical protein GF401_07540 [Chitinivibrionales bacterium]|nr:hypothetical protein [Chitinivibrionales bacterium]
MNHANFSGRDNNGKSIVINYELNADSIALLEATKRLYAWIGPDFPEDLAFYTKENLCRLGSITHEKFSFFNNDIVSIKEIKRAIPKIKVRKFLTVYVKVLHLGSEKKIKVLLFDAPF